MDLDVLAFAGDCRLRGRLPLSGDRLSDLLNTKSEYTLYDVEAESLLDGHAAALDELVVQSDDLYAVEAVGPRGDRGRRIRKRTHRMQLQSGPYLVAGYLHSLPGAEPLASITQRGTFVALTDATLTYRSNGVSVLEDIDTILMNRTLVEWIRPVGNEAIAFPNVLVKADPRAKDMTWEMHA